jgi:hypothetical protein
MAKRGRPQSSAHHDITDDEAVSFFDAHLQTSRGPTGVWPYSKGKSTDSKKAIVWADAHRTHSKGLPPHPPTHPKTEK